MAPCRAPYTAWVGKGAFSIRRASLCSLLLLGCGASESESGKAGLEPAFGAIHLLVEEGGQSSLAATLNAAFARPNGMSRGHILGVVGLNPVASEDEGCLPSTGPEPASAAPERRNPEVSAELFDVGELELSGFRAPSELCGSQSFTPQIFPEVDRIGGVFYADRATLPPPCREVGSRFLLRARPVEGEASLPIELSLPAPPAGVELNGQPAVEGGTLSTSGSRLRWQPSSSLPQGVVQLEIATSTTSFRCRLHDDGDFSVTAKQLEFLRGSSSAELRLLRVQRSKVRVTGVSEDVEIEVQRPFRIRAAVR